MCGICGFNWSEARLIKRMTKQLQHRGPDADGVLVGDGFSIGHRRLAIVDLSAQGRQPMTYAHKKKEVTIVFNGEIYNYKELRTELRKKGYRFSTGTDTEVILAAYLAWGERCVSRFNGMWALCIHDPQHKKLFLSRDRLGIKPLYYHFDQDNERFAFASESRAIKTALVETRRTTGVDTIDPAAIGDLFRYRVILDDKTLWQEIRKLPPGHNITYNLIKKELIIKQHWELKQGSHVTNPSTTQKQLKKLLESAVKMRLMGDVPVGVALSGGLDSSIVAAIARKHAPNITAYTVGFGMKGDENAEAAETARTLDMQHKNLMVDPKYIEKHMDAVVRHLEEPAADPAIFASYAIYERIRKDATVLLLGEGSDELFGGYMEYKLHGLPITGLARNPSFNYLRKPFKKRIPTKSKRSLHYRGNLNNYLLQDVKHILPNFQLLRVDKMSMAHSLEARVPFLDHRIAEYAMRIPANMKLTGLTGGLAGKHILRKTARQWLPETIINRNKKTFFSPLSVVEKTMLQDANGFLKDRKLNEHIAYEHFRKLVHNIGSKKGRQLSRGRYELFNWWLLEKMVRT